MSTTIGLLNFATHAPEKADPPRPKRPPSASDVRIIFKIMSVEDAQDWHRLIQPDIRRVGFKKNAEHKPVPRADRRWHWPAMRRHLPLLQQAQGRKCLSLTINVTDFTGRLIPAAMMMMIEGHPWIMPTPEPRQNSVYTWFISAAPDDTLKRFGVQRIPSLGMVMVETAMITSFNSGENGRMWLHAAPEGGAGLLHLYGKKCGMKQLPAGTVVPVAGQIDDRFFYADESVSTDLIRSLDPLHRDGGQRL